MPKEVLVIGGGPAGMMAAGQAALRGARVTLTERNPRCGRKLMITGKGRCNVTNACDLDTFLLNINTNPRFLYSAYCHFTSADTVEFFEAHGVPLKTERGNRVFPVSDKAVDIVDALVNFCRRSGVRTLCGRVTDLCVEDGRVTGVKLENGETLKADAVILATGGVSYPLTGSTGDGYALAEAVGHSVMPPRPSLVPLEVWEGWCTELMGLSLKNCAVRFEETQTGRTVYEDFGELLFTHFGVSGPVILSASAHLRDLTSGRYTLHIDLKPALSEDKLDERLLRDFAKNTRKDFRNSLDRLLPAKLIPVFVRLSGIAPGRKVNQITREERCRIVRLCKDLPLTVEATRPIEEAIVTAGGVCVSEVNPKTMESKKVKGLYFAGEILDVDAYTGGFNLQIAFCTGYVAGKSQEEAV